jgi:hypothetical protein
MPLACARPLSGTTRVPNPLDARASPDGDAATYDITIRIKDLKQPEGLAHSANLAGPPTGSSRDFLPSYIPPRHFPQSAVLEYSAPNEVRVGVALTAEWRELASLDHYKIELRDDKGLLVAPDDLQTSSSSHRDYEANYAAMKNFQTVRIHDNAGTHTFAMWAPEEYSVSERIYRARGTVVFRGADLLRHDTRFLTLSLKSSTRTLRFTWQFDPPADLKADSKRNRDG